MSKVLVADPIAQDGIDILSKEADVDVRTGMAPAELLERIGAYDALVVRSETKVTAEVFAAGKLLRAVGRAGVGVDNIDLNAATERGVIVLNAPLGNTISAAEHAVGLMLALARHIPEANASLKSGEWNRKKFEGYELRGKTLGLVGLGNVGSEVAKRGKGLDMHVIARDPYISAERAAVLGVELVGTLDELLERSDFLSLHTVAQEQIIGERELAKARPSLFLINTARGNHVDYDAMVKAIDAGRLAGAAIDVFPQEPPDMAAPVLHNDRIIVTPHLGALTAEAQERVAVVVAEQIAAILRGEAAQYAVNAPIIAAETMTVIAPYISVAEMAASLATQLAAGQMGEIEIDYAGEIGQHDTTPLRAAVVKGLLSTISEENVTIVNAAMIAEHRGMRIIERKLPAEDVYANLVRVHLHTSAGDTDVAATMAHDGPHVVQVNESWIDIPRGEGWLLLCENEDRPGAVGAIGTFLGQHDVNISFMNLSRNAIRGRALMALVLDDAIAQELVDELAKMPNFHSARVVKLS